jgi:hypothetical protein
MLIHDKVVWVPTFINGGFIEGGCKIWNSKRKGNRKHYEGR